MNLKITLATSRRVLLQLLHDPRTIIIVIVMPCILITLLKYVFYYQEGLFNSIAPSLLGIFPLFMMFLVTSIATLRERTSGTLDRLMTEPISKLDFMIGYAIAFCILALIQVIIVCSVSIGLLGVTISGSLLLLMLVAAASGFLGTSLGLLVSAFCKTEFQAVQMVMPILMPQVLLCGLFIARDQMAPVLETISDFLPLTYSVQAMQQVATSNIFTTTLRNDLLMVFGFGVVALILGSITIRRSE